jgi:ribosomal protein L11 methylase PrmA
LVPVAGRFATLRNDNPVSHPEWSEEPPTVIDIGCGSGILSIAAIKLGALHALGGYRPTAILVAGENAALNGVHDRRSWGWIVKEILANFSIRQASRCLQHPGANHPPPAGR